MTTPATEKQINFIKKLDPTFNEFEGLDKLKASRMIGHLLKAQKGTRRTSSRICGAGETLINFYN